MGRLDGKVAIVTGAGTGQGAAEARLLAQEGARVVATDINFGNVSNTVAEIEATLAGRAIALHHDVSKKKDWLAVARAAAEAFGLVNVLVNNAGIWTTASYDVLTYEHWQKIMDVNAWSQFVGIQTIVPMMKECGVGSIINVASLAAVNACGRFTAYTASKGAIDAFSRAAAVELAEFNIRVNCINPGVIHTPMLEGAFPTKAALAEATVSQPLLRMGRPIDVAYLVLYLASDESWFTTGTSQIIDGGLSVMTAVRPRTES
jgi:NAD(P)-dependent dehydrogenase (short-subunit alcohol dehydrogenase family)